MFYNIGAVIFCTNFYFSETSKLSGKTSDQKYLSSLLYAKGSTLKGGSSYKWNMERWGEW